MKELGVKVLTKIENLISVIEKKPNGKARKGARRVTEMQQEPVSQQKNDHDEYLRKLSYSFVEKKEKVSEKMKQQAYQKEQPFEPFKISNKTTKAILNKKNLKPIHERMYQIMNNKLNKIMQIQKESFVKQTQESLPLNQLQDNSDKNSYNKAKYIQLDQFRQEIDQKNHERIKKMHFLQLQSVKRQLYNGIPQIATSSRSLSKIYNEKRQLSDNVFQRLTQDYIDRNRRKSYLAKKRQKQQGGFSPYLCQKSRTLVLEGKAKRQEIHLQKSVDSLCHQKCKKSSVVMNLQRNERKELQMLNPQVHNRQQKLQKSQNGKISGIQKMNLSKSLIKQSKQQLKKFTSKLTPEKIRPKQVDRKNQIKVLALQQNKLNENKTSRVEKRREVQSTAPRRDTSFKKHWIS